MRKRLNWGRDQFVGLMSSLESRSLLSGGVVGLSHIVQDLGTVTASAAASGVEVTALISPQSSVTFRFSVQEGGQYTLLVRHVGEGLTLQAKTPGGTASVEPGVAGPFQVVPLSLENATYEITASAQGDDPVYVDWELLLNSGIGQSAAETTSVALIPLGSPAPNLTTPTSASTSSVSSTAPTAGSVSFPLEVNESLSIPIYLTGGPVGRASLETASPPPMVALLPEKLDRGSAPRLAELDAALMIAMQATPEDAGIRSERKADHSWFEDLWGTKDATSTASEIAEASDELTTPETDLAQILAETTAPVTSSQRVSMATISPGLALGAIAVTVAARSRIKGNPCLFVGGKPSRSPASSVEPSLQRLRAIFDRSYRADRCQPVRPLHPARRQARS